MINPKAEIRRPKEARNPKCANRAGFCLILLVVGVSATLARGAAFEDVFREGVAAYRLGDYVGAVKALQQSTPRKQ